MYQVTPEEAREHLLDLIDAAMRGERVVIAKDDQQAVQLIPFTHATGSRRAGSAKGVMKMSEDFDAPLADFDEYTR